MDLIESDIKNEETLKKAEEATGQLQAQLGLINAQSQNLTSTQQTVQALVDELKRTKQVVETQLEMVKAQIGGLSEEVAEMIKSVTDASVAQYLSGIKIHTKNTNSWRKEMEDWIKEGKGEEWWDTEMEKWDTVDKDEFDAEKEKLVDLAKILMEMGEINDQNMLILQNRLDFEGCHCGDRKGKEKRKRVEE